MTESQLSSPSDESLEFTVAFHRFTRTERNLDLQGKGTLMISSTGEEFAFYGTQRGPFSFKKTEISIPATKIRDAFQIEDRIYFTTPVGESGTKNKPFIFFCQDAKIAAEICSLLPSEKSTESIEEVKLIESFQTNCPAPPPLASPTNVLIGINLLIFVLMAGLAGTGWIEVSDLTPYIKYGANNGGYTTNGEWYRLFNSIFLHYGLVHVGMNIWVLSGAGHLLERLAGRTLYLMLYIGSGLIASLASIIWNRDTVWSAGASGAVFGVFGALLAFSLLNKKALPTSQFGPLKTRVITFIAYNLIFGVLHPGIDNAAHVGGLLGGFLLGLTTATPTQIANRVQVLKSKIPRALAAAVALFGIAFVLLPNFDYDPYEEEAFFKNYEIFAEEEGPTIESTAKQWIATEEDPTNEGNLLKSIEGTTVAFYANWIEGWETLDLTTGSQTDRNRTRMIQYSRARSEAYQKIATALRDANQSPDIDAFQQDMLESNTFLEGLEFETQ